MGFRGKKPSSLDYETLLHEIALKNWRRALPAADFPRAFASAEQLARSKDRFWRWQGLLDVATTHVASGASVEALEALDTAKAVFPDVSALQGPALEMQAYILVETGRLENAVALEAAPTPLLLFQRAVALTRLRRFQEARALLAAPVVDRRLAAIVEGDGLLARSRTAEAIDVLRRVAAETSRTPAGPAIPAFASLGRALVRAGDPEGALAALEEIAKLADGLFHWTFHWVRSSYLRGELLIELGEEVSGKEELEGFLRFWGRADFDREIVARAAQLVKA